MVASILDNHHRISATWEYEGSAFASELKAFCDGEGIVFGDFVKLSTRDVDLGFWGACLESILIDPRFRSLLPFCFLTLQRLLRAF
jgi:hypothetical protein